MPCRAATAAAVAVVAAAGLGFALTEAAAPVLEAYTTSLHHGLGAAGSGQAVASPEQGGWSVAMTASHLEQLPSDEYYQCLYLGPGNRPGHPDVIAGGSFTVGAGGSASIQMWTAANPAVFPTMEVVVEKLGIPADQGTVVLAGKAED